jgi:hypothetical protein
MNVEAGKSYLVKHSRKGTFAMRVDKLDDEWATGVVIGGKAKAMLDYNECDVGDEITVRRSFCQFTEQPAT